MIPTPATFRRDFSHFCFAAVFWLCWPNARQGVGSRLSLAESSHKETETSGGRTRDSAGFGREPTWTNAETVFQVNNNNRWPHGNVRWHCFIFCDTRRHCLWMTKLTERSWWDRNLQHALTESPTPVFATTSFTARMAGGWASIVQKPWIQGSRTFLGFGPRICTSGAPRS